MRLKGKIIHGRFEENLNASADAIYSNDFSIAKGRIGTEHSQPLASLVAVLYEHDSHGESVFRLCNHITMVLTGFYGAKLELIKKNI